jgi:hypothetical protein
MTTQIIDQATYDFYKASTIEERPAFVQEQIEAYESEHGLNVDAENFEEAPVIKADEGQVNAQEVVAVTVGTHKGLLDELIAAGDKVIEKAQMAFTNEAEKNVYLLTYLRACFGKTERFTQPVEVDAKHRTAMAALGSCLSWMPISTKDVMSRKIKEMSKDTAFNYAVVNTDCDDVEATYTDRALSNGVSDHVLGSQFIYHNSTLKPSHNLNNQMGNWKLAVTGEQPVPLNPFATAEVHTYRGKLTQAYDALKVAVKANYKNMVEKYKDQLLPLDEDQLLPLDKKQIELHAMELAIAELHSPEMVEAVITHIRKLEVTNALKDHVKLACIWSLKIKWYQEALPEEDFIATATLLKFAKENKKAGFGSLSRQTLPALLKELGLFGETGKEVLGISTTAIAVEAVITAISKYTAAQNDDVNNYLTNISEAA